MPIRNRRGLAARNLLFATAVTAGLISLMLLKENHERWMRSASGAAVKPAISTTAGKYAESGTTLSTSLDQANVQFIAGKPIETATPSKTAPKAASGSNSALAAMAQSTPTTNRACQEALDRGKAFLSEGRAGNAVVLLRQAIGHDRTCAEAHYHLGLAYSMQGDVAAARAQRDQLQTLNPNLASLLGNLVR